MKTFVNKAGVLLVAVVIAGKIIFFPAQALANQDYNPNTFELNINQTEFYKPKQTSLEEITNKLLGEYTTADKALITGMFYGVDDAKKQIEEGMTNPFGEKFDYILASNPSGNIPLNLLRAIFTNIGNSPMTIKGNYGNIEKLRVNELWCQSQGCDTFINWANKGIIKVNELRLTGVPIARGSGYINKLRNAAARAGIENIYIYQNLGDEKNHLDGDYVTTTKLPSLQQVKDSKSFKVGMVWEIGDENLEAKVNIKFFELYTSNGKNENYTKDGIEFFKIYNMPKLGHRIENYYENIKAIPK